MVNDEHLLEEYRSLREEILGRQNARMQTLQFTMAALAAIIGILGFLKFGNDNGALVIQGMISSYILSFSILGMIIIIAALFLTIQNTLQIFIISQYISQCIETRTDLNWQTSWIEYRKIHEKGLSLIGGTNKALALLYAFLAIPFLTFPFVIFPLNSTLHMIVVLLIFVIILALAIKLYRVDPENHWDEICKKNHVNK